jgi:D-alanyl-D-alanine carboxypeptidase
MREPCSIRSRSLLGLLPLLLLAAPAPSAGAAPAPKVQRAADALVASGAPGVYVLVQNGSRTTAVSAGYGNRARRTPMRAPDRFRVGSVTKTFVASVVMQLVAEHKVGLDDTVAQWLPGVVPNGKHIEVRQLLNMQSGLFDFLNDGDRVVTDTMLSGDFRHKWTPLELVRISTKHPPNFAPGRGWRYCNTCYVLLGLIVEKATGHSIGDEIEGRILRPNRLSATRFETTAQIAGPHTHGYARIGKRLVDATNIDPSYGWSAGAVTSTAADIARFYRRLLSGRIVPHALLREMAPTIPIGGGARYGYGLASLPLPCGPAWGHDGGAPGYRTFALTSPDGTRQAVVFANLDEESLTPRAQTALNELLAAAFCG